MENTISRAKISKTSIWSSKVTQLSRLRRWKSPNVFSLQVSFGFLRRVDLKLMVLKPNCCTNHVKLQAQSDEQVQSPLNPLSIAKPPPVPTARKQTQSLLPVGQWRHHHPTPPVHLVTPSKRQLHHLHSSLNRVSARLGRLQYRSTLLPYSTLKHRQKGICHSMLEIGSRLWSRRRVRMIGGREDWREDRVSSRGLIRR